MLPVGIEMVANASSWENDNYKSGKKLVLENAPTNGQLQLNNELKNRKFVLYESANNDFQYYGFGIENGGLDTMKMRLVHRIDFMPLLSGSASLLMSITGNQVIQMGS
ncbi:MAG: hypothetical protein IPP79_18270 [Chitinophagaceae bacterium]|nr:hypothetical protein [Chitinophagaceae bacterium]